MEAVKTFLKNSINSDGTSFSLVRFLEKTKKGSRTVRNIFLKNKESKVTTISLRVVKTFYSLIQSTVPCAKFLGKNLRLWNLSFLLNKTREFAFKFFNNNLGLNVRTANFVDNIDRSCSLCVAAKIGPPTEETFEHLFFYCPVTSDLRNRFLATELDYLNEGNIPEAAVKNLFFEFFFREHDVCNLFLQTLILTFQSTIWDLKLKKRAPSYNTFISEFFLRI